MRAIHRETGELRWHLVTTTALHDRRGALLGTMTEIEDMTAVKTAEIRYEGTGGVRAAARVVAGLSGDASHCRSAGGAAARRFLRGRSGRRESTRSSASRSPMTRRQRDAGRRSRNDRARVAPARAPRPSGRRDRRAVVLPRRQRGAAGGRRAGRGTPAAAASARAAIGVGGPDAGAESRRSA